MNLYDRAYAVLARMILFPLHERVKGHETFAMLREMERDQWAAPEQLRQTQERRLRLLLAHAHRTVKYYRNILDGVGWSSAQFDAAGDLSRLPFLTKQIIRSRLEDLRSVDASGIKKYTTGGSTGSPVAFYLGPTRISSDVAARWRAEGWWGVGIGHQEYVFWGSPLELSKQDRVRGLRDRILRTRLMSAFEMNPAMMDEYLDEMVRNGCRRVCGYPSSIVLLCEHARRQGRDLSKLGVRAVFVTAEYLWDHWRETISETFGCPVANGYGGRDSGFIAHECPAGGMHVTADRIIVEIVGEDDQPLPNGELGEIVVTHLDTPEMPFIRYRTEDMGTLSSTHCSCGRTLPLLQRIEGRKSDFILAPDGRLLHGLSLIYILRNIAGIEQFRITQKSVDNFGVELVTNGEFNSASESEIRREFRLRLRSPVHVDIYHCKAIPATASGKFRYVISEVAGNKTGCEQVAV